MFAPPFFTSFGLSFKSLDVTILLHLNNNGKRRYISRKRATECFAVYVFEAKYQSERTTEESFTDEMNTLHCCEALLNTISSRSYFFL